MLHGTLNVKLNMLFNNSHEALHGNKQHTKSVHVNDACVLQVRVCVRRSFYMLLFIYFFLQRFRSAAVRVV
jgi:hypothetical protein